MKIIFFGTPSFSADVLSYLLANDVKISAVITKPDRPQGRSKELVPTPVKVLAQSMNPPIPVYQPEIVSALEFASVLTQYQADLFVVVAYGEIIKQHLLEMPRFGCINLHTSLLPKYRGAAPIQRSIINGESVTGVTIMYLDRKMDTGDVIKMVQVPIEPNTTLPELENNLCQVGSKALLDVIRDLESGNTQRIPQDHSQATYAPKIELEDCQLNWVLSAQALHNLVRGVVPNPGAWCYVSVKGQKKRLKINETRVVSELSGLPGQILIYGKEGLVIACGTQALRIMNLQLEGKKAMSADELIRGTPRENLEFLLE